MHIQIHDIDGKPFVANPYQTGTYIREDVFWRQFSITCFGEIEYLEDDPVYGTWRRSHSLDLGHHGLIEDAKALAEAVIAQRDFDLLDYPEALAFHPERIQIRDRSNCLVLAGQAWGNCVRWSIPVASDEEAGEVAKRANALRDEASFEAGWDNFSTAQGLRLQASVLEGRLVAHFWRVHARKVALAATS
ncbi:hypothetical protein NRY95_05480 [Xanthomonas campestris pv. phormiicola]|nr:hypothetical protein [Xanthomonas campestris pv. phormiicola]UYC17415.1 hypothetical protein NRY95_05480 [Xanthomonas campestris pv. phormiicola]